MIRALQDADKEDGVCGNKKGGVCLRTAGSDVSGFSSVVLRSFLFLLFYSAAAKISEALKLHQ